MFIVIVLPIFMLNLRCVCECVRTTSSICTYTCIGIYVGVCKKLSDSKKRRFEVDNDDDDADAAAEKKETK